MGFNEIVETTLNESVPDPMYFRDWEEMLVRGTDGWYYTVWQDGDEGQILCARHREPDIDYSLGGDPADEWDSQTQHERDVVMKGTLIHHKKR